MIQRREST
jgi:hypothetical protein